MIHHIFANKSNIGDWLSAKGIQSLIRPFEIIEHFCDQPYLNETLRALMSATEDDLIIIGGGGLFMDYFTPFWEGFLPTSERVPFCIWGVGFCDVNYSPSIPSIDLLTSIVKRARVCVVRDVLSRDYLSESQLVPAVACPSMNTIRKTEISGKGVLHVDAYDNVGDASYKKTVAILKAFATNTHRSYRQTNNIIKSSDEQELQKVLSLYRNCDLVVSSRLHGCIVGVAMGRKVLAISGDKKVDSFMCQAGLEDWLIDSNEVHRIPEYLDKLHTQLIDKSFCTQVKHDNELIARRITGLILGESSASH